MSFISTDQSPSASAYSLGPVPLKRVKNYQNLAEHKSLMQLTANARSVSSEELREKDDLLSNQWLKEAKKIYPKLSAILNTPYVQYVIALDYFEGEGKVKQNNFKALFWMTKAAEGGNPHAQHTLGSWYIHGTIVGRSYEKAKELLISSADQKNYESLKLLEMYFPQE